MNIMNNKKAGYLNLYSKISYGIVTTTEKFYYNLGYKVAEKPWVTIALCWSCVFLSVLGFLRFHQEKNPIKLWVPPNTKFMEHTDWLMSKYQTGFRTEAMIINAPDVLTPEVLLELAEIDDKIHKSSTTKSNIKWKDICFKIPHLDLKLDFLFKSYKNNSIQYDPSVDMNTATYCTFIESIDKECYEKSLLELWDYNVKKIKNLTKQDILNKLERYKTNLFGGFKNYEFLLGGIKKNQTGHIIGAESLHTFWMVNVNFTAIDMDKSGNMAGTADWASEESLEWEEEFERILENATKHTKQTKIFYTSARSFGDISNSTMWQDMDILIMGIFIMVLYVIFVLSKYNWLELRVYLGVVGLIAVGMAFVTACGICALFGVSYGPVHTSLPFLLMGLGVDDMFVIASCWEELKSERKTLPLPVRIGNMLKHAGVSITITSFTDVCAFLIGSSTILPCLGSFCIYAAVGVLITFIYVVTFFVACFTIDEIRIEKNRHSIALCIKMKDYKKPECSKKSISTWFFYELYSKVFFSLPVKILIVAVTVGFFAFSLNNTLKLKKQFDPIWFIPEDTHLIKYLQQRRTFYPHVGFDSGLYMGALNYTMEIPNIQKMVDKLESNPIIVNGVTSWVAPFRDYVQKNFHTDIFKETLSDNRFNLYLSKFLFSPRYAKFQANFIFKNNLECGIPAPEILMSNIDFRLFHMSTPDEYLPAMHTLTDIANGANFTTGDRTAIVWSKIFSTWVTDELIDVEVARNLQLALLCVMACTVFLIANLQICFWVFLCVVLTMVNVCGFMQQWGLTIDLVSCIGLELAIGLCVDYATHMGHTFLTVTEGTRTDRALKTVTSIGSAVLFGGFSTFIGVSMLGFSKAYAFQIFFKIFLLVILFGLFHGIILLPVILTWVGPKPYHSHELLPQNDNVII